MNAAADHAALALRWRKLCDEQRALRPQVHDAIRALAAAGARTGTLAKVFGYRRDQVYRIVTGAKRRERRASTSPVRSTPI